MKLAILFVAAASIAAVAATVSSKEFAVVAAKDVKWTAVKDMPPGTMSCLLDGDLAKGPVLSMNKVPAGTLLAPHTHSADEIATVISGAIWIGRGDTVDESKATLVEAGSYVVIPANSPHWAKTKADTTYVRYCNGPADIKFLAPAK
ncbi:MAG: cupin domain-containing protein [Planctomycetota bacterium]